MQFKLENYTNPNFGLIHEETTANPVREIDATHAPSIEDNAVTAAQLMVPFGPRAVTHYGEVET